MKEGETFITCLHMQCRCGDVLRVELSHPMVTDHPALKEAQSKLAWQANNCKKTPIKNHTI